MGARGLAQPRCRSGAELGPLDQRPPGGPLPMPGKLRSGSGVGAAWGRGTEGLASPSGGWPGGLPHAHEARMLRGHSSLPRVHEMAQWGSRRPRGRGCGPGAAALKPGCEWVCVWDLSTPEDMSQGPVPTAPGGRTALPAGQGCARPAPQAASCQSTRTAASGPGEAWQLAGGRAPAAVLLRRAPAHCPLCTTGPFVPREGQGGWPPLPAQAHHRQSHSGEGAAAQRRPGAKDSLRAVTETRSSRGLPMPTSPWTPRLPWPQRPVCMEGWPWGSRPV